MSENKYEHADDCEHKKAANDAFIYGKGAVLVKEVDLSKCKACAYEIWKYMYEK